MPPCAAHSPDISVVVANNVPTRSRVSEMMCSDRTTLFDSDFQSCKLGDHSRKNSNVSLGCRGRSMYMGRKLIRWLTRQDKSGLYQSSFALLDYLVSKTLKKCININNKSVSFWTTSPRLGIYD